MEYVKKLQFTGSAAKAMEAARAAFMQNNFQITASSDRELRVVGSGMSSTKENALKGVSEATITISSSEIEARALLGGAEKMKKFVIFFPLALALLFFVIFGVLALSLPKFQNWMVFLIPVLALSPWVVISPLMAKAIEKRTIAAVDTLLNNMVMVSQNS
jgi:hypothetical protein